MNNVNTIFYFANTYDEYREKLDTGLVSPLTIVFVLEQKAIYKGVNGNGEPVRFGNMTVEDIKQAINSIIGDTLAIENNKLDVDTNTLFSDPTVVEKINSVVSACLENPSQDFTNTLLEIINNCITSIDYPNLKGPKGDPGLQGEQGPQGPKGDDGYSITKIISTPTAEKTTITFQSKGVNLGSFDVHNGAKGEKGDRGPIGPLGERGPQGPRGPEGQLGPLGEPGIGTLFDDSEIWEKINLLDDIIEDEKDRLNERIDGLDSDIDNNVRDLKSDINWLKEHGNSSNFGEDDVEQYLLILGVWSENEVHDTDHAIWSKIRQSVDGIELRVGNLETNGINTELLSSTINQKIANGEIQLNLENTYAKKTEIDDIEQIIEWIYSGLKSSASKDKSIVELFAAQKEGMLSAISDIRVLVNKLENGEYLATTSVDAKVKDSISGMLATADSTTAAGRFFSNVGSALSAGLITEANLKDKGAIAGLMAKDGDNSAVILNSINNGVSNIKIKADKIDLSGITTAEEVIIKNGSNLEAGMTNGSSETVENVYRDDVRIWAGTPRTVDNRTSLANCPFYVTNTGAMHAEGANISGNITATEGNIGGFTIDTNILHNSNWDSGIDISTTDGRSVKIGKNATGEVSTESAIIRAENTRLNQTHNTALYLNAQNAKYNYAFYGNGNGVLNGLMFGYKTQLTEIPSISDDKYWKLLFLANGSTIILTGNSGYSDDQLRHIGGLTMMMPTLSEVKNCLGLPDSSTIPFAIELNVLNLSDCTYLYLGFNYYDVEDNQYPINTGFDGQTEASLRQIAQHDYMKILLVYYNNKYRAYIIVNGM